MNKIASHFSCKAVVLVLTTALLFLSMVFLSLDIFVEPRTISKWYAFICGALLCSVVMLLSRRQTITVDWLSGALLVFVGYLLLRGAKSDMPPIGVLILISFILLYLFFRANIVKRQHVDMIIVLVCLLLAIYGILQYAGVFYARGGFKVVGSFDNPAGFAASLAIGFPFCFSLNKTKSQENIGRIAAIIIAVAIILSESRAGMLAVATTLGVFLYANYKHLIPYKRVFLLIGIGAVIALGVMLFHYKKDSASGRLLIWKNSVQMVADKPVTGQGAGAFLSKYMLYQADYFDKHPDSRFSQLADNTSRPFNEYFMLAIEYGLIGVLLLIFIGIMIFRSNRIVSPPVLALISVAIFALFSYPLAYAFVVGVLAYCLAGMSSRKTFIVSLSILPKLALSLIIAICSVWFARDIKFEYKWKKIVSASSFGRYEMLLPDYDSLYRCWNGDPYFLYNYGAVLYRAGRYEESNKIVYLCTEYFNDYDVQMLTGENYLQLGQLDRAAECFALAHHMIPNRFIPLKQLLEIYKRQNDTNKAQVVAEDIVSKEVKINSVAVIKIKRDAQTYLESD